MSDLPAVRVPGSTSNLGPGFDLLGLAVDLWLDVRVLGPARGEACELELAGEARVWPGGSDDHFVRALDRARRELGGGTDPLALSVRSEIPVARGLGSSGAAVAAGLRLGAALSPRAPAEAELLRWGIELEGHPDNVAASLLGGCTLCLPGDPPLAMQVELSDELAFAAAWPEATLSTARARAVLPASVPHADAVENARRLPVLLEGLRSGRRDWIRRGGADRLHVPFRLPLIPGGERALFAGLEAGAHLVTISGSGSALFAVCARGGAEAVAAAMADAFRAATGHGTGRALEVARLARAR